MALPPPAPVNFSPIVGINGNMHEVPRSGDSGPTQPTNQVLESPNLDGNVSAHTRPRPRKRKALNADLECLCGSPVSPEDISDRKAVRCKKAGCETEWVSGLIEILMLI